MLSEQDSTRLPDMTDEESRKARLGRLEEKRRNRVTYLNELKKEKVTEIPYLSFLYEK